MNNGRRIDLIVQSRSLVKALQRIQDPDTAKQYFFQPRCAIPVVLQGVWLIRRRRLTYLKEPTRFGARFNWFDQINAFGLQQELV